MNFDREVEIFEVVNSGLNRAELTNLKVALNSTGWDMEFSVKDLTSSDVVTLTRHIEHDSLAKPRQVGLDALRVINEYLEEIRNED